MKSRTLFSKLTPFKKDITRFAPLWAVYFIGGLLVFLTMADTLYAGSIAQSLTETIGPFAVINLIYAALAAQLLFGDLYQSRLCNALHAMPLRRETWFLSHVAAGLCYSLVPHIVALPFVMFPMGEFWYVGAIWLLGMTLEYLFFFGLAVFCALCVGNRFAMVAVYGILNFGSLVVYWFCSTIYGPLMYGVVLSGDTFFQYCPVVEMASNGSMILWDTVWRDNGPIYTYLGFGQGWDYLVICAGLGVALLVAALLIYRRRALESAGDFIAVKPLAPVFCVVCTLCVGAVSAVIGDIFTDMYVFFIVGVVVGFFASKMLIKRTVKVFQVRSFLQLGLVGAMLVLSVLLVKWDAFGIVRWLPETHQVKSVTIDYEDVAVTRPEDIDKLIELQAEAIQRGGNYYSGASQTFRLTYTMKSGRQVIRCYKIPKNSKGWQLMKEVKSSNVPILSQITDLDSYLKTVDRIQVDGCVLRGGETAMRELMEAMLADYQAGNMIQDYEIQEYDAIFSVMVRTRKNSGGYHRAGLTIFASASNTIAWLKDNADLWDADVETVEPTKG